MADEGLTTICDVLSYENVRRIEETQMLVRVEEAVERFEELIELAGAGEEVLIEDEVGRIVHLRPIKVQNDKPEGKEDLAL